MLNEFMDTPIIQLWEFSGMGLIVAWPSGVRYSNQTGGYACLYPELEGVFAPLAAPVLDQQAWLRKFFTGRKWRGNCYKGIDEETANFIDSVLIESSRTEILRVNRERLADSHEAWVHVLILEGRGDVDLRLAHGFAGARGVLTWQNSD